MNIIGIKNNLVKFIYEEDIKLSDLIGIKDSEKSYIAQVLQLEATRSGKLAIAKLIFCYDGQIRNYDGSVPSIKAEMAVLDSNFVLNEPKNTLTIGKIGTTPFLVDFDILKDNPIILSEKFYITKVLLNNIALQLQARKHKLVVFDTAGIFKNNKLSLGKDFKLPLNSSSIDFIYEKIFDEATPESKAMIQSIFEELSEYAKTIDYIPFESFKSVIDSEFARTKLIQLIILKNKIKEIQNQKIFAQTDDDIIPLKSAVETNGTTVIDLSKFNVDIQNECIKYVYSVMDNLNDEFYAFVNLSGNDKQILNILKEKENIHTTVICDYDYANLAELKKISKNMFLFSPLKQQADYGTYNSFLQKLSEDEFIAYGKMTKFVPIITKLVQISGADIKVPAAETAQSEQIVTTQTRSETAQEISNTDEQPETKPKAEETLTNDTPVEAIISETVEPAENSEQEIVTEEVPEITEQTTKEEPSDVIEQSIQEAENDNTAIETVEPQVEIPVSEPIEEIPTPIIEDSLENQISQMAGSSAQEIELPNETETPDANEITSTAETEAETPVDEVAEALNEVPDIEEEDELSDDDLDMIEKLSKPDEEIPVISEPVLPQEEPHVVEAIPSQEEVIQDTQITDEQIQEQPFSEPQPEPPQEPIEEIQEEPIPQPPQQTEPIPTRASSTPVVPEYSAEIPEEDKVNSDPIQQGDRVFHQEFGEGVVEKMINYGDKVLCSINFTNVGRRLLNPDISEMKKI